MENQHQDLLENIRELIDLSQDDKDQPWDNWINRTVKSLNNRCWEIKQCGREECPAYLNDCGRCWLIAGTMCQEGAEGVFARKYRTCTSCDVYKNTISKGWETEMRESLIILTYSLRSQRKTINESEKEIKILQGLLPICAGCKKIRDENGSWVDVASYISRNSEAEFTHGMCPKCMAVHFPGV